MVRESSLNGRRQAKQTKPGRDGTRPGTLCLRLSSIFDIDWKYNYIYRNSNNSVGGILKFSGYSTDQKKFNRQKVKI
jgi:hypothetical protein